MTRRELALQLLRDAGDDGVTTAGFLREGVGSRYGARLMELREEGYEICARRLRDGCWRYQLVGEPSPVSGLAGRGTAEGVLRGGGARGDLSPLVPAAAAAPSSCEGRLFELPARAHYQDEAA